MSFNAWVGKYKKNRSRRLDEIEKEIDRESSLEESVSSSKFKEISEDFYEEVEYVELLPDEESEIKQELMRQDVMEKPL